MSYQFLTPENIAETYRLSKQYTESLTSTFPEYERLMRNKPHPSTPKEYPKTTDGTTASIIRKTPHRIIQQLPTGRVISDTNDWLSVIASFIYRKKIIPNANEGYALLQKCWSVVERFLGFGSCPTYTPFVNHGGYFCTDLRLPYWGDIFLQPGKLSDADSNYIFLRSWWQTNDINNLIETQKKINPKLRTWDIEALEKVKDIVVTKEEKAKTPIEREAAVNEKGGVELITGFQRGFGSKFYTFHVQNTGTGAKPTFEGTIVRVKPNKDPRGELPVSFAYGDIDGSNPLGRSIIELVGGMQNLLDAEMQMYQYNRALQLNPPLIKRGNFNKNQIVFAPNRVIDVGSNPDATVEPLKIDTTALTNFPDNYGLMKSTMLNLLSSPDTSISAEIGNPGFSKTPQGVEASKANLSIDDNYVRKQFETWFERWSETAINLYFAERTGIEELQLDDESAEALRKLAEKGKFNMAMLSDDNKVRIDYNVATEQLKFEVDASSSKKQNEIEQLQSAEGIIALLDKTEFLQRLIPLKKQLALYNSVVDNSGFEQKAELKITAEEADQAIQQAMAAAQQKPREQILINYKDAPEDIKRQIEAADGFQPSAQASPVQQQLDQKAAATKTPGERRAELVLKADKQAHENAVAVHQATKPEPKPAAKPAAKGVAK